MKLFARVSDAFGVPGGRAVMLFDEEGECLPNQAEVTVTQASASGLTSITVKFLIDGDSVQLDLG